jgi:subtilisin family serine protease
MRGQGVTALASLALLLVAGSVAGATPKATHSLLQARDGRAAFVAGELIVQFNPGWSTAARRDALGRARVLESLGSPGLVVVRLAEGASVRASAAALQRDPRVAFAEPNYVYRYTQVPPDDPSYAQLWGLNQASDADIDAPEAWGTTVGSDQVKVAVIDSGVAYDHPDLAENVWANPGETPGNALDDDSNGFVDDVNGWDFVQEDNTPLDYTGHGTHVAGTVGAVGNNAIGVTGVNQNVAVMALRAGDSRGLEAADVLEAVDYACDNGADVANGSFGTHKSRVLANLLKSAACRNTLFVFAAGNDGVNLTPNFVDTNAFPCEYHRPAPHGFGVPNLLCVAASTRSDGLAVFSNRGPAAVHLAAPGGNTSPAKSQQILSTWPGYTVVTGFPDSFEEPGFASRWGDQLGPGLDWLQGAPFTSGAVSLSDSAGQYRNNSNRSIRNLNPIDLTGLIGCRMDYELRLATEGGFDFLDIYALTGTGVPDFPDDLTASWSGSTAGEFLPLDNDVSTVDGESAVYIRFALFSDETIRRDGAYIDELVVKCLQPGGGGYEAIRGTSMASPHVAGVAALLLAANPALTVAKLKNAILKGVDKKVAFANRVSTGGRLNAGRSIDVALDMTPPDTAISGRPPALTTSRRATFRFRSNEAGSTFQCRHMNGAWLSCSSPKLYTGLAPGMHMFRVRAIDRALNVDPTPSMDTWRIRR